MFVLFLAAGCFHAEPVRKPLFKADAGFHGCDIQRHVLDPAALVNMGSELVFVQ